MKSVGSIVLLVVFVGLVDAQPSFDRGRDQRAGGMPRNAVLGAIDADGNHEISAEEMIGAVQALKALDLNEDGKLARDEIHPHGPGGPGAAGSADGRPRRGLRGRLGRGRENRGGVTALADRLRNLDKDKDGKITMDELPTRLQQVLDRYDANGNGSIDETELSQIAERFADVRESPGGGPQDRIGSPNGRRPRGGGPPPPEQMVEEAMSFDANQDGVLSKAELMKFAEEHARRGPPNGNHGHARGRGGPGVGPQGGEVRPDRPARPE